MREPVTRRAVLDDAAFDAAVRRVVERTVAAAADDTAGARVVARLLATPTRRLSVAQMLLAPAAMALVALVLLQEPRTTSPVVPVTPGAASQPPIDGAAGIEAPSPGSTAALDHRGADRRVLVGVSMAAAASSARRRARPRVVAAPLDDDPSAPPALVASGTAAGTTPGLIEMTPAPEPLPVDALELVPLDAAALDPGHDE